MKNLISIYVLPSFSEAKYKKVLVFTSCRTKRSMRSSFGTNRRVVPLIFAFSAVVARYSVAEASPSCCFYIRGFMEAFIERVTWSWYLGGGWRGLRNAECPNPWEVAVALAQYRRSASRSSLEIPGRRSHHEGDWKGCALVK